MALKTQLLISQKLDTRTCTSNLGWVIIIGYQPR